jgi:hypothetical protein
MDLRHAFDITPWDRSGSSFLGLKRSQAKWLGIIIILIGLSLADPPFSIFPTDFINIALSGLLYKLVPTISLDLWLLLTYTVIAWGTIYLGAWIYPYNTESIFNGYLLKFQRILLSVFKSPLKMAFGLTLFYFMFQWYKGILGIHVDASAGIFHTIFNPSYLPYIFVISLMILGHLLSEKYE